MRVRFASLFALTVLCLTGAGGGTTPSRVLWQGPLLAGDAVAWIEDDALHVWSARGGGRTVYRGDSLAVTRPFAASPSLLAFERSYPGCPPPPGHVCPEGTDALFGPHGGPFRALTRSRTCFLPSLENALALDGTVAAFVEIDCTRQRMRVVVRDRRARMLRDAPIAGGCCRDIAVAGRYVAWSETRAVVVYDRIANRIAYRARIGRVGIDVDFDFDLQRDGKLAVAFRLTELALTGPTTVGWFSPSSPRLHVLAARGSDTRVGIAADRIAFERFLGAAKSDLVVADFAGRAMSVAQLSRPNNTLRSFDIDGRRLAWASERITARRVDCPPPGEGRPCIRRVTGVTSISRRTLSTRTTRVIARLRFEDVFGR